MKKYVKKLISSLIAISLAVPLFSSIPVFAENSDGTIVDQTQALTVVGKRIKGDDTYFEISLEVNDDHDNYSSVGVVLRYDPDYIVPAESWDEGAGAADMSDNTTWATRRALPTLGLETWSAHTALAYQEDTPAPGAAGGKKYGYLYLGAEHPLAVEDSGATPDPSATPDPTPDPSDPTPEPTASPEPGTRPVVVARFMYKTDSAAATPITGADTKLKLETDWLTGANNSGAAQATNWDYDWTANQILTIASDDVAGKSPAQYPFAIYTQDYVEKAYMHTWPVVTPTATPVAGDPTPTPMPVSAYAPVIGSGIDSANYLTAKDIMIITCVGESAKATGGLKLSDVFMILFFDWDDTIIGSITAVRGGDMRESVEEYVKEKLMHPKLAEKDYGSMTQAQFLTRENTYRGEYPYDAPAATNPTEPGGANTVTNGEEYPLSNKLDYVIAGIDLDTDYPRANCWTLVDKTAMSDVWTVLEYSGAARNLAANAYAKIDQTTGYAYDSSGNPDPAAKLPELVSYDFGNIQESDIDDGILYVKAVYRAGLLLDKTNKYYTLRNTKYTLLGTTINATVASYSITHSFERINNKGQGVARVRDPKFKAEVTVDGMAKTMYLSPQGQDYKHGNFVDVELITNRYMTKATFTLFETYGSDALSGTQRGTAYTGTTATSASPAHMYDKSVRAGIKQLCAIGKVADLLRAGKQTSITVIMLQDAEVMSATGAKLASITTAQKTSLKNMCDAAKTAQGTDEPEINYYMIQYALLNNGDYVAPDAAKAACVSKGYGWCS